MASLGNYGCSSRALKFVSTGAVVAVIVTAVFSLAGVAFGILFIAIDLIAPGTMIFIAALMSLTFTTIQSLALRSEMLSTKHEGRALSHLQTACSVGLPLTVACWLIALGIDLGANEALHSDNYEPTTQKAALAVVSIGFAFSTILLCLVKTRVYLLDPRRYGSQEDVLPYANHCDFRANVPEMVHTEQPTPTARRSLLMSRASDNVVFDQTSPNHSDSDLSALPAHPQPPVTTHPHGKVAQHRAKRRSRLPSSPPTGPVPPLPHSAKFGSKYATQKVHAPTLQPNVGGSIRPRSVTMPSAFGTSIFKDGSSRHNDQLNIANQDTSVGSPSSTRPLSHREHLLRKLSGLDRSRSKSNPIRKLRMIPSSPTLGAAHHDNIATVANGTSVRDIEQQPNGFDKNRSSVQQNSAEEKIMGRIRSSSSLGAPRTRSRLSLVEIAEEDENVPPVPKLLPELGKTNLSRLSVPWAEKIGDWRDAVAGETEKTTDAQTKSANAIVDEGRKHHEIAPTEHASIYDGRFSDVDDDSIMELEPAPASAAPLALHPVSKSSNDTPPPLNIAKTRSTVAGTAEKVPGNERVRKGTNRRYDEIFSSVSRPSTAATTGSTKFEDFPPIPTPPILWQQHSLLKRHQLIQQRLQMEQAAGNTWSIGEHRVEVKNNDGWTTVDESTDSENEQTTGGLREGYGGYNQRKIRGWSARGNKAVPRGRSRWSQRDIS